MGRGESGAAIWETGTIDAHTGGPGSASRANNELVVPLPRNHHLSLPPPVGGPVPPLVIAVAGDPVLQRDLVRRIGGTAVVILVPDLSSAAPVLAMLSGATQADQPRPSPSELPAGFEIDERLHSVRWRSTELPLTEHEHQLLVLMAGDPERVCTREQLHAGVWGDRYLPHTTHLQSTVKRLRRKLADAEVPLIIGAVRSVGYRLHRTDRSCG